MIGFAQNTSGFDQLFYNKTRIWQSFDYFCSRYYEQHYASSEVSTAAPSFNAFCRNSRKYISLIFSAIKKGEYVMQSSREVAVYVDKLRTINKFPLPDRFLLTHLARTLAEYTETSLPDTLYSFRAGLSNKKAVFSLASFIANNKGPFYVLRRDIKNFGEQMRHEHIFGDFTTLTSASSELQQLITTVCRFPIERDKKTVFNFCGLPTGAYIQLVFENIYLLPLDRVLSSLADSQYARFGDDIAFVTTSKKIFTEAEQRFREIIAQRGLLINTKKEANIVLSKPSNVDSCPKQTTNRQAYFDYLGLRLWFNSDVTLPPRKQRAIQNFVRNRLKSSCRLLGRQATTEKKLALAVSTIQQVVDCNSFVSKNPLLYYLEYVSNEKQLREFDRWIALTILKVVLNKGFSKSNFRHVSYKNLRERGLPSLLHLRRQGEL